jgi:hypothetical protein
MTVAAIAGSDKGITITSALLMLFFIRGLSSPEGRCHEASSRVSGAGFFGQLVVERLGKAGLQPIVASRTHGELRIDANNADDLKKNLKPRDLVVDCAGPFQSGMRR